MEEFVGVQVVVRPVASSKVTCLAYVKSVWEDFITVSIPGRSGPIDVAWDQLVRATGWRRP
jgi:hypothetical protein